MPIEKAPSAKRSGAKQSRTVAREARVAAAKVAADDLKARKLHVIAERRAKKAKLSKSDYIKEIVKGKFPPITAADLAAEPNPDIASDAE